MKEIPYKQVGDYFVPDLRLPQQDIKPLGKFGRMRLKYLKENSSYLYNNHLLNGTLNKHCSEVEEKAESRLAKLIESMAKAENVTEALKTENPIRWVGLMNSIKASATEIVVSEIIFA